jgi:hypothetical protein
MKVLSVKHLALFRTIALPVGSVFLEAVQIRCYEKHELFLNSNASKKDEGGYKMKTLLFGTMLLALVLGVVIPATAAVDINISLPPLVVFDSPPDVIVMPDTQGVYVVPDIDVDMFFWNGWWWRLWEGRWYRSQYYNRGWGYYNNVPTFYFDVDPGWRGYYRDHNWSGHRWNYERVPHQRLQQNWKVWHNERHWEKRGTWGVEGYRPRPQQQRQELRHQREEQYHQRPEVQQHRQQRQQEERRPQAQKPQRQQPRQPQERVQEPQRQEHKSQVQEPQRKEQRPQAQQPRKEQQPQERHSQPQGQQNQGESRHSQPQEKPQGGDGEHKK